MATVPSPAQGTPPVPLTTVRALLDAVEAVLDSPKPGTPDPIRERLAHMSGVLSAADDERSIALATRILVQVADRAQAVPGE